MITEAIILAGGFGTRLQKVVSDVPKPMALINDRPFLEYQLGYLKKYGIKRIVFAVGYLSEVIENHFKNHFNGIDIGYAYEENPLGTGGGIQNAISKTITEEILVLNGDTLFEIDIINFYKQHHQLNSSFSLSLRQIDDVSRYGIVITDDNIVKKFAEKGEYSGKGQINGGVYLINRKFFTELELPQKFSLEKDVLEKQISNIDFYGFSYGSYFLDIGIPDDYKKAQDEFKRFNY